MRRYFDDNDEVYYMPPAWYLWPLWWIALPVLVAIDKIQCWIVTRGLWRREPPAQQPAHPLLKEIYSKEYVEELAKQRGVDWSKLKKAEKDPERLAAMRARQAGLANTTTNSRWPPAFDEASARLTTDKDPDDGTD